MREMKAFTLVLIIVVLALSACSAGGGAEPSGEEIATPVSEGETSGQSSASPTQEQATPRSVAQETPTAEQDVATPAATEEDLNLPGLTGGLAGLDSYKSTFSMRFVGKDANGNDVEGTWETQEEFTREPRAQRIVMTTSGSTAGVTGQPGTFGLITIGDMSYMITKDADGTTSCISMSSSEESDLTQGIFTPDMMGSISGAKYAGRETVNGVDTKHYTWKETSLPVFGFASASGEVWVATDGDYVVRYSSEASGSGTLFGAGEQEGTVSLEYNLTDVNGSFTIEAPAECETAATDIPVMADAQDKATFGEMLSYSSPSALVDVVEFYKTEMPANGWQPSGEPMEMEDFATLSFAKDGRTAQVMITTSADTNLTSVVVTTGTE
jgi:hypothetical protein